jgi:hypothetical protein
LTPEGRLIDSTPQLRGAIASGLEEIDRLVQLAEDLMHSSISAAPIRRRGVAAAGRAHRIGLP